MQLEARPVQDTSALVQKRHAEKGLAEVRRLSPRIEAEDDGQPGSARQTGGVPVEGDASRQHRRQQDNHRQAAAREGRRRAEARGDRVRQDHREPRVREGSSCPGRILAAKRARGNERGILAPGEQRTTTNDHHRGCRLLRTTKRPRRPFPDGRRARELRLVVDQLDGAEPRAARLALADVAVSLVVVREERQQQQQLGQQLGVDDRSNTQAELLLAVQRPTKAVARGPATRRPPAQQQRRHAAEKVQPRRTPRASGTSRAAGAAGSWQIPDRLRRIRLEDRQRQQQQQQAHSRGQELRLRRGWDLDRSNGASLLGH